MIGWIKRLLGLEYRWVIENDEGARITIRCNTLKDSCDAAERFYDLGYVNVIRSPFK